MKQFQSKYVVQLDDNVVEMRISEKSCEHRYSWDASRHCNADYELHVMLRGEVSVEVEQSVNHLSAGQAMLIMPGKYHMPTYPDGQIDHFSISFSFLKGGLERVLQSEISDCKVFRFSADTLHECTEVYNECTLRNMFSNKKIELLLTSIIISTFRCLEHATADKNEYLPNELVRSDIIDNFFDLSIGDCPTEKDLAGMLHITTRHLGRVMYKLYGMSFQQKLIRERMERAAWLLQTTNKTIDLVSAEVGYKSEAAFYKAFIRYFKTTPRKYRLNKN